MSLVPPSSAVLAISRLPTRAFDRLAASSPFVPVNALVLYEDATAAQQALRVVRRLTRGLHPNVALRPHLWRFDIVTNPFAREAAAADARDAQLFILATSSTSELPPALETWLNEQLRVRDRSETAVLTLFGPNNAWAISLEGQRGTYSARQAANSWQDDVTNDESTELATAGGGRRG